MNISSLKSCLISLLLIKEALVQNSFVSANFASIGDLKLYKLARVVV